MTLLICGFGPFPQAPDNPAADVVRRLQAAGWSPAAAAGAYAVLPTVWARAAEAALAAMRAEAADAVLLVGVAVGASGFRVETVARNLVSPASPDAEGALWAGLVIDPEGPRERTVTAPTAAMRAAIAAIHLPAELSDNAGDYLCNFTLYRLLAAADGRPVGFLHIPATGDAFAAADIQSAVRAAAETFAAALALG